MTKDELYHRIENQVAFPSKYKLTDEYARALRDHVLQHVASLEAERDALRAELAKEKANASLVGTWEQAARKAAGEDGVQFVGDAIIARRKAGGE